MLIYIQVLTYFKISLKCYVWSFKHYVLCTLLLLVSSTPISSEIQITTIDPWRIVNADEHVLLDNKFCEDCYVR